MQMPSAVGELEFRQSGPRHIGQDKPLACMWGGAWLSDIGAWISTTLCSQGSRSALVLLDFENETPGFILHVQVIC